MNELKIIGLGEIVWDRFRDYERLGGAPLNFAYFASQLGAEAYVISAVGKDEAGERTLAVIGEMGVRPDGIQTNEYMTGIVDALPVAGTDDIEYVIHKNAAWDHIRYPEQAAELLKDVDVLCWGTLAQREEESAQSIGRILSVVPESCLKVYDINIRQDYYSREIIEESLKHADILKLNENELPLVRELLQIDGKEPLKELMERYGLQYVVHTQGSAKSEIYGREGLLSSVPTKKVELKDAVGAGDSFTAVFVTSLLQGKGVRRSHELAVEVAAYVCTQEGAINPLPSHILELL